MSDYLLHGITLALAWFLIVNVVASAGLAIGARHLLPRHAPAGAPSPAVWLLLRLGPAIAASTFVCAAFLPSYWKYEPREFVEGFDVTLTTLAAAAVVLLFGAAVRGIAAWYRADRRNRVWIAASRPLATAPHAVPAFQIDGETPFMALVGVIRPRLILTRGLAAALTAEELAAGIAHELGHSRARDNLKRLMMRAAPDVLAFTRTAGDIERRWASASEHRADAIVARQGAGARCALASALVKVARLVPPGVASLSPTAPISPLVGGGEIASRVERLLEDRPARPPRRSPVAAGGCGLVSVAVAAATYPAALRFIHSATELLVQSLP